MQKYDDDDLQCHFIDLDINKNNITLYAYHFYYDILLEVSLLWLGSASRCPILIKTSFLLFQATISIKCMHRQEYRAVSMDGGKNRSLDWLQRRENYFFLSGRKKRSLRVSKQWRSKKWLLCFFASISLLQAIQADRSLIGSFFKLWHWNHFNPLSRIIILNFTHLNTIMHTNV